MKFTKLAVIIAISGSIPVALADHHEESKDMPAEGQKAPEPGTIADMVVDGQTFSILEAAVKAAGLEETLAGKGPFTVFAPTDEAFGKLDKETLDALLLPENKEKLRSLLLYHVVAGTRSAGSLTDEEVKTMNGEVIEVDVDGGKVKIEDGSNVVNADLAASNGVIHVVDKVLVPKSLDGFEDLDED